MIEIQEIINRITGMNCFCLNKNKITPIFLIGKNKNKIDFLRECLNLEITKDSSSNEPEDLKENQVNNDLKKNGENNELNKEKGKSFSKKNEDIYSVTLNKFTEIKSSFQNKNLAISLHDEDYVKDKELVKMRVKGASLLVVFVEKKEDFVNYKKPILNIIMNRTIQSYLLGPQMSNSLNLKGNGDLNTNNVQFNNNWINVKNEFIKVLNKI